MHLRHDVPFRYEIKQCRDHRPQPLRILFADIDPVENDALSDGKLKRKEAHRLEGAQDRAGRNIRHRTQTVRRDAEDALAPFRGSLLR